MISIHIGSTDPDRNARWMERPILLRRVKTVSSESSASPSNAPGTEIHRGTIRFGRSPRSVASNRDLRPDSGFVRAGFAPVNRAETSRGTSRFQENDGALKVRPFLMLHLGELLSPGTIIGSPPSESTQKLETCMPLRETRGPRGKARLSALYARENGPTETVCHPQQTG